MKSFDFWILESLSDEEMNLLSQHGYHYLDEISVNGMKMILVESPDAPHNLRYHLAFQRDGKSSFNYEDQFSRDEDKGKGVGMVRGYQALKPLMNKLVEWLKTYKELVIASANELLTKKWIHNLILASRIIGIEIDFTTKVIQGKTVHFIKLK